MDSVFLCILGFFPVISCTDIRSAVNDTVQFNFACAKYLGLPLLTMHHAVVFVICVAVEIIVLAGLYVQIGLFHLTICMYCTLHKTSPQWHFTFDKVLLVYGEKLFYITSP